jgi:uncharacterized repeat protein (TIGR03803 family)
MVSLASLLTRGNLVRILVPAVAFSVGVAACSRTTTGPVLPLASTSAQLTIGSAESFAAKSYSRLYSFSGPDGENPLGGLIAVNGTLYGTTTGGFGTIFSMTRSGIETTLHGFTLTSGTWPQSELLDLNGVFYGTTKQGGPYGAGTIFRITPAGKFQSLFSFRGPPNGGYYPYGGLVAVNGMLYGTTANGGVHGYGMVFSITPTGRHMRVLHSFSKSDGAYPHATLTLVSGMLYGVTNVGGAKDKGVVFRIGLNGAEAVVHSFSGDDGYDPEGRLLQIHGVLYGTTVYGGTHNQGTVFQMSLSGNEKVLYSFDGAINGCAPYAGLVAVNGLLYGVTSGWAPHCTSAGTLFRISPTGSAKRLHTFGVGKDGANPFGGLVLLNHKLYGTTESGGQPVGSGTVYWQTP